MAKVFKESLCEFLKKINDTIVDEKESGVYSAFKEKFDILDVVLSSQIEQIKNIPKAMFEKIAEEMKQYADDIIDDIKVIKADLEGLEECFTNWYLEKCIPKLEEVFSKEQQETMKALEKKKLKNRTDEESEILAALQVKSNRRKLLETVLKEYGFNLFYKNLKTEDRPTPGNEVFAFRKIKVDGETFDILQKLGDESNISEGKEKIEEIKEKYLDLFEKVSSDLEIENTSLFDEKGNLILKNFYSKDFGWCDIDFDKTEFDIEKERLEIPFEYINEDVKVELDIKKNNDKTVVNLKSATVCDDEIKLEDVKEGLNITDLKHYNEECKYSFLDLVKLYLYFYKICYKEYLRINKNVNIFNKFVISDTNEESIYSQISKVKDVYKDELDDEIEGKAEDYIRAKWDGIFEGLLKEQNKIKTELVDEATKKEFSEFLLQAVLDIRNEDILSNFSKIEKLEEPGSGDVLSKNGKKYIISLKGYMDAFKLKGKYLTKDDIYLKILLNNVEEFGLKNSMFYIDNVKHSLDENGKWKKDYSLITKTEDNGKFQYYTKSIDLDKIGGENENYASWKTDIKNNYINYITYEFTEHEENGIVFDFEKFKISQIKFDFNSVNEGMVDYLKNLKPSLETKTPSSIGSATSGLGLKFNF